MYFFVVWLMCVKMKFGMFISIEIIYVVVMVYIVFFLVRVYFVVMGVISVW